MKKQLWREVMFADGTIAEIDSEGLLYRMPLEEFKSRLPEDAVWTRKPGAFGVYFNDSRDRLAAEFTSEHALINPSYMQKLFGEVALWS